MPVGDVTPFGTIAVPVADRDRPTQGAGEAAAGGLADGPVRPAEDDRLDVQRVEVADELSRCEHDA